MMIGSRASCAAADSISRVCAPALRIATLRARAALGYTPAVSRDPQHSIELDLLELRQREEAPVPGGPVRRETSRVRNPENGAMPRSERLLERLYHGELTPRERKPQVVDTRRCWGPFMVTVDEPPMVLLDACSQIATLSHGFADPNMLRALHEGRFDDCLWANPDSVATEVPELAEFAALLRSKAPA